MREKKEREEKVMKSCVEGMCECLCSSYLKRKRRREEMKGMKEMREERRMIEREGGRDSLISFFSHLRVSLYNEGQSVKELTREGLMEFGV
jgi:hypothetical protein